MVGGYEGDELALVGDVQGVEAEEGAGVGDGVGDGEGPRTASVNPTPIDSSGTSNCSQVWVRPARTSSIACSAKWRAAAAAYAWK